MLSLSPSGLKQAGYLFACYQVSVKAGTPFSALMVSEFWVNVGGRLRVNDEIRAVCEDGSFDAHLTVSKIIANPGLPPRVTMRVLRYWDPSYEEGVAEVRAAAETDVSSGMSVSWGGPSQRWRIVDSGGNTVEKNHATKEDAEARMVAVLTERKAA